MSSPHIQHAVAVNSGRQLQHSAASAAHSSHDPHTLPRSGCHTRSRRPRAAHRARARRRRGTSPPSPAAWAARGAARRPRPPAPAPPAERAPPAPPAPAVRRGTTRMPRPPPAPGPHSICAGRHEEERPPALMGLTHMRPAYSKAPAQHAPQPGTMQGAGRWRTQLVLRTRLKADPARVQDHAQGIIGARPARGGRAEGPMRGTLGVSVADTSTVWRPPSARRPQCCTSRVMSSWNCTASSWSTCARALSPSHLALP